MFSCCREQQFRQLNASYTYYQFDRVNPNHKQRQSVLIKHFPHNKYDQFEEWRRTKLKSQDYREIVEELHARNRNFVDEEFAHEQESLGWRFDKRVEWVRLQSLIKDAVYYSSESLASLTRFRCSNKALEIAISVLARNRPELLKNHMLKCLDFDGIYQFCLLFQGQVVSVLIDDYIPAYGGKPIFCCPFNINECFPMLLEKALAKLYGSYKDIPTNPVEVLESIACTPVTVLEPFSKYFTKEKQAAFLNTISNNHWCVISKDSKDIQDYGLRENQSYQLLGHFTVNVDNREVNLVQLQPTNENELNSWNGAYSLFDPAWEKVSPGQKNTIQQSLNKANSFAMQLSEFSNFFIGAFALENIVDNSVDWLELRTDSHHGCYAEFYLTKPTAVFLRLYSAEEARQVLILVEVRGNNYSYVVGSMQQLAKTTTVKCSLKQGRYLIFLKSEWESDQPKTLTVLLSCKEHAQLKATTKQDHPNMLQKMFNSIVAITPAEEIRSALPHVQYLTKVMYRETGYAFLWVRVLPAQQGRAESAMVEFDEKNLKQQGFKVRKPYAHRGSAVIAPGETMLFTLKILNRPDPTVVFPSYEFRFLEQRRP